ncbi:BTB/POZ domain-containing protein 1-like protein [Aphelenchoides avenae]|nr:BTB/POZ domain-containing protein 1-like protein [Aphelenchus avenae]
MDYCVSAVRYLVFSYIYTDEVVLTPENAFPVLYLATKYMLTNLVTEVLNYVATAYSGESVAKVLPHMHLIDGEIAKSVWDTIDLHADVVLKSPEFLDLSHAALCDILRRDFNIDELTVYNSAVAWVKAECARKQLSFETHAREVLGNALKLIRFPLMSIEEFASGPARSSLLSDKEKLEVYGWYGLRSSHDLTTFSSAARCALLSSNRFDDSSIVNCNGGSWANTRDYGQWFFDFKVSTRVRFHGIAFFGRKDESNVYEVDLELLNANSRVTLETTHARVTTVASKDTYKVLFDQPVPIEPGTQYKVRALSIGPKSMFAENGMREVTRGYGSNTVTFEFIDTGRQDSDQYDVALRGHIPMIYFSFT